MNLHFILIALKFSGSCNNINDPYVKMCVPDVVKNLIIVKMKQDIELHGTCKGKCILDASVWNNKNRLG